MYAKAITLIASLLLLQPALAAKKDLKCEIGPVQQMFGQALWNLYACDDSKSMVAGPANAPIGSAGYFFLELQMPKKLGLSWSEKGGVKTRNSNLYSMS